MEQLQAHRMLHLVQACRDRGLSIADLIRLQADDPEAVSGSLIYHVIGGVHRPSARVLRVFGRALDLDPAELVGPLRGGRA